MANKLISKARLGFLVNVIILEVVKSGESTLAWDGNRVEESTSLIEVVSYQGQARTVSPGAERVRSTSGGWLWDLAQALVQGMNEVLNQAQAACHAM